MLGPTLNASSPVTFPSSRRSNSLDSDEDDLVIPLPFALLVLRCQNPLVYQASEKMVTAYVQAWPEWTSRFSG